MQQSTAVERSEAPETPKTPKSLREEIALKKELKKKQEEQNLTFKPALVSRSGRDSATKTVAGSRFDHLYNDAVKRQSTELKVDTSGLTFSPKINQSNGTWKDRDGDTANRLYNASGAGRPKPKEEKPESFKPKITKRAKSLDRTADLGSRLHSIEELQRAKLEKAKEDAEKKALADCTFKPKVTARSKSFSASAEGVEAGSLRSALDHAARLHKFEEKKKAKVEELRKEKEAKELEGVTFKPQISTHKRAPSLEGRQGTVYERLNSYVPGVDPKVLEEHNSELTFKPHVFLPPSPKVADPERNAKYGSIYGRLHHEGIEKMKEKEEECQRIKEERESYSFQPTVPLLKTSSMREISDSSSVTTSTPVFERLSTSKQYMQNILTQIKADLEMSECTFKPDITDMGKSKKESDPVHERLLAKAQEMDEAVRRREEEKIALELADATFAPQLPQSSQKLAKKKSQQSMVASNGSIQTGDIFVRLNSQMTMARSAPGTPPEPEASPGTPMSKKAFIRRTSSNSSMDLEGSLLERFAAHEEKKKEEILRKQEELLAEQLKDVTFSPNIPKTSEKLARKKSFSEVGKELTPEEKFHRLNSMSIGKSENLPSELMDATFSPQLNATTEAIARRKIVELSSTGSSGKVFDRLSLGGSVDSSSVSGLLRTASRSSNAGTPKVGGRVSTPSSDKKSPTANGSSSGSGGLVRKNSALKSPTSATSTPPAVRGKVTKKSDADTAAVATPDGTQANEEES